jgi:hypothetical protein
MAFNFHRLATSEQLLDVRTPSDFVGWNALCLSKSLMASMTASHFKKREFQEEAESGQSEDSVALHYDF